MDVLLERSSVADPHVDIRAANASPLPPELLRRMHGYWRAANYLSVGQTYLSANPLLERPLTLADIKPRLLGH